MRNKGVGIFRGRGVRVTRVLREGVRVTKGGKGTFSVGVDQKKRKC